MSIQSNRVAVTGGAGYIGAHMCKLLAETGHDVTVFDDLSTGHEAALQWGHWQRHSLHDTEALTAALRERQIDAVFHFAGAIVVSESVRDPLAYYQSNLAGTLSLLTAMQQAGVRRLIFSSTAAIFGEPVQALIDESHPVAPISPYGHSKAMVEQVLRDCAAAGTVDTVALRYFNAAGADPSARIGEAHEPETHLIPLLLRAAADGQRPRIFGADYPTPDGTCLRDYIHVNDLCSAHLLALSALERSGGFQAYNLGYGRGHSVLEVIRSVEAVTGVSLNPQVLPRRPGDPARLVASPARIKHEWGWTPQFDDLQTIVQTAWQWECRKRRAAPGG